MNASQLSPTADENKTLTYGMHSLPKIGNNLIRAEKLENPQHYTFLPGLAIVERKGVMKGISFKADLRSIAPWTGQGLRILRWTGKC